MGNDPPAQWNCALVTLVRRGYPLPQAGVAKMASPKPLNGWSIVEVPGGWAVVDGSGARLAFVAGDDKAEDPNSQGLSNLEAWQLASCIAALPQILLNSNEPKRRRISHSVGPDSKFTSLYERLLTH
jgi:hypothetical protein